MPVQIESQVANAPSSPGQDLGSTIENIVTGGLGGLATEAVGALGNALFGKTQAQKDQEQLSQQGRLQDQQIAGQEQLANYQQGIQEQEYDYSAAPHQVDLDKAAGLNPALMYGGGGGGGGTLSGSIPSVQGASASDSASQTQANIASSQQLESMKVMDSQANLNNAQAAKISGVDTQSGQQDVQTKTINNQILQEFGMDNAHNENIESGVNAEKTNAQWEAFKTAASTSKDENGTPIMNSGDENNPYVKALKAGMEQAETDLKTAQAKKDLTGAQAAVETFKANLAKQGIDPDSPWYVNIIGDLLGKIGLNPITNITGAVKKAGGIK